MFRLVYSTPYGMGTVMGGDMDYMRDLFHRMMRESGFFPLVLQWNGIEVMTTRTMGAYLYERQEAQRLCS